ncbi:MAG: preprotein translocase subunit YidC, partial [Microgenomates group bacterium Gr01-1014_80]
THFFGINLASKPSDFASVGAFVLFIPLITAALTFVQSKMMMPVKPLSHHKDEKPKEAKEKEGIEDAMASMQGQMMYLMPLMIGYFAFTFPIGLAIYWNTFTIMGIIQQYLISGWGGMADFVGKVKSLK